MIVWQIVSALKKLRCTSLATILQSLSPFCISPPTPILKTSLLHAATYYFLPVTLSPHPAYLSGRFTSCLRPSLAAFPFLPIYISASIRSLPSHLQSFICVSFCFCPFFPYPLLVCLPACFLSTSSFCFSIDDFLFSASKLPPCPSPYIPTASISSAFLFLASFP